MSFRAPLETGAGVRRRWFVIAGVTALVLLDVVLIVWALGRPTGVEAGAADPAPIVDASDEPSEEPRDEPTASPTPSVGPSGDSNDGDEIATIATIATQRILTALDEDIAWRATTGDCPDATASPEVTADGGETWLTTDATGPTGVTALQRIIVASVDVATFVGAEADGCAPTLVRTYVRGDNYADYPDEVDSAWHVPLADRSRVNAPGGLVDAPCAAVSMIAAAGEMAAAVLCADGTVSTTADAGAEWSTPLDALGAHAIAPTDGGYLIARLGGSSCAGVGVAVLDAAGAQLDDAGCLPVDGPLAGLAGQVAIADGDGVVWLWVGDRIERSTDRGGSWF